MATKSAQYCQVSRYDSQNEGYLLLCEVALGDMWILSTATPVKPPLPEGKNSVMGFGQYHPDPNTSHKTADFGVRVPIGKPTKRTNIQPTSLVYNEYIIYDANQVNIRYIVKVKFNY